MYGSLFFHECLDDSRVEIGRSSLFQWQWLWRILESARAGLPESSPGSVRFYGSWESNLNKFSRYHPTAPPSDGTSAQVLFTMFLVPSRQHPRPKQRLLVIHVASRACRRWSNLKDPADADWERLSPPPKSIVDEAMWLDAGSRAGRRSMTQYRLQALAECLSAKTQAWAQYRIFECAPFFTSRVFLGTGHGDFLKDGMPTVKYPRTYIQDVQVPDCVVNIGSAIRIPSRKSINSWHFL